MPSLFSHLLLMLVVHSSKMNVPPSFSLWSIAVSLALNLVRPSCNCFRPPPPFPPKWPGAANDSAEFNEGPFAIMQILPLLCVDFDPPCHEVGESNRMQMHKYGFHQVFRCVLLRISLLCM